MGNLSRTAVSALALCAAVGASSAFAEDGDRHENRLGEIKHVLLLSVDGLHAVDLATCEAASTCPNLTRLTGHGVTYTHASTTKPSDSFPGMLAQVTGATSKSTGVFYDDSYDRTLFAPSGNPPAPCTQ